MRGFRIAVILLAFLLFLATTASAVPSIPSSFYGTITMNGANVALSADMVAYVADMPCGKARLWRDSGTTWYSVSVNGDDTDTPGKECGVNGDVIQFRLNGVPLATTAIWAGGTVAQLDLAEISPHRLTATPRLSLPVVANKYWPPVLDTD
jgi:hypothetical protein